MISTSKIVLKKKIKKVKKMTIFKKKIRKNKKNSNYSEFLGGFFVFFKFFSNMFIFSTFSIPIFKTNPKSKNFDQILKEVH